MTSSEPPSRGGLGIVPTMAGLSFLVLTLELFVARTSIFFISAESSFIAIPLTLFGLAVGSLALHLRPKALERFEMGRALRNLGVAVLLAIVGVFAVFSATPIVHSYRQEFLLLLLVKVVAFVVLLLTPLALAGRILAALFTLERERIGHLYAADLVGAALGAMATPILLHFFDLPVVIGMTLVVAAALPAMHSEGKGRWMIVGASAVLVPIAIVAIMYMDSSYDMTNVRRNRYGREVEEVAHRWNEFSRVSLLRYRIGDRERFMIIHDNAESNVNVAPYAPGRWRAPTRYLPLTDTPFVLGRPTRKALVMFAGAGAQMIEIEHFGRGRTKITGVEINPAVVQIARDHPALKRFRLRDFFALDNVELRVQEGRSFLRQDHDVYDFIFAGTDAPPNLYKSGHARKYLDTMEALEDYIWHLNPEGVLVFAAQPVVPKLGGFRRVHERRFDTPFNKSIIVMGNRNSSPTSYNNHIIYSPRGFSEEDVETLRRNARGKARMYYAWSLPRSAAVYADPIEGDMPPAEELVTDERPFLRRIDWSGFTLFPTVEQLSSPPYFRNWIHIESVLLVGLLVLLLLLAVWRGSKGKRPSPLIVVHLLLSGFGYMMCQITFLQTLELFLSNPLVTMALLLSLFLLMNGAGSALFQRYGRHIDIRWLAPAVLVLAWVTYVAVRASTVSFLGWPLVAKLGWAALLLSPLTLSLGLFYPFAVTWLTNRDRAEAVPVTFGLSTLSSVAGGTWALAASINFGYTGLIHQAMVVYGLLALVFFIAGRENARV